MKVLKIMRDYSIDWLLVVLVFLNERTMFFISLYFLIDDYKLHFVYQFTFKNLHGDHSLAATMDW